MTVGKGGGEHYRGASTPSPLLLRASLLRRLRQNSWGSSPGLASSDQKALGTEPKSAGENHSADLSGCFSRLLRAQCVINARGGGAHRKVFIRAGALFCMFRQR
jgi:hypothetical protein